MRSWIVVSNSDNHLNLIGYLGAGYKQVDWRRYNYADVNVGDAVYVYSTMPIGMIKYKMKIISIDIKSANYLDDQPFWKNGYATDAAAYKNYKLRHSFFRMELLSGELTENEQLDLDSLRDDLKFNPRTPIVEAFVEDGKITRIKYKNQTRKTKISKK